MLIGLWIFLIILGILFRKSNKVAILQVIYIAFMVALNTNNPDRNQYYSLYTKLRTGANSIFGGNVITNILFKVFSFLGSYELALFAIVFLCMFLIFKAITYHTKQVSFVLSLYLIASFTIDATQVKNFIAMSIWLYFLKYLHLAYSSDEKRGVHLLIYLLGCLLSTGAHFSFVYMFLFTFVVLLRDKNIRIRTVLIGIVISLIVFNVDYLIGLFNKSNLPFFAITTGKFIDYRMTFNQHNMLVRMRYTVEVFVIMEILLQFCKYLSKKHDDNSSDEYIGFLTKILFLSFFSLPFMKYSLEIYRIQRNLLILFYIFFAKMNCYEENKKRMLIVRAEPYTIMGLLLSNIYLILDSIFGNFEPVFRTLFRI